MEVEEEVQPSSEYETVSSETKRPCLTQMRVYSPRIHRGTEARCNVKQSFVKLLQAEANKEGPPDDTPIDSGYVQWHSDGTEIMNSGRPPQNGDFCLGVWEKTGRSRYKLNHFALGNVIDPTNPTAIGRDR
jgi:hypothetical protein